mgnify:CR=1 FL=1
MFQCCKIVEYLADHFELCSDHDAVRIIMPEGKDGKPPYYYFQNYHKQIMATNSSSDQLVMKFSNLNYICTGGI